MKTTPQSRKSMRKATVRFSSVLAVAALIFLTGSAGCTTAQEENQLGTEYRLELALRSVHINEQLHYLNEEAETSALVRDPFRYLYINVPEGFYIVSAKAFPGAEVGGIFDGEKLTVEANDQTFEIMSDTPLLGEGTIPAYVRFDQFTHRIGGESGFIVSVHDRHNLLKRLEEVGLTKPPQ